jgi:hypothetical protein
LQHRLKINEHVRGLSFYVPVDRCCCEEPSRQAAQSRREMRFGQMADRTPKPAARAPQRRHDRAGRSTHDLRDLVIGEAFQFAQDQMSLPRMSSTPVAI